MPDPAPPLASFAARWLDSQRHRLKRRTLETYAETLRTHLLPAFGPDTPLALLTPSTCHSVLVAKRDAGYATLTVRLMLAVLRAMLGAAVLEGVLATNPAAGLGRFLPKRKGPSPGRALSRAELDALLHAMRQRYSPLYPLVLMAARTGLRIGELLGLRWRSVDLRGRRVVVQEQRDHRGRHEDSPKSGKTRVVGLSRETVRVLQALFEVHGRPPLSAPVFCGLSGESWSRSSVWRALHQASAAAALPPKSAHALRITFGTQLDAADVRLTAIRDLLGHHSVTITEGYIEARPQLGAVDRLDRRVRDRGRH